jgi:hypothetical protein
MLKSHHYFITSLEDRMGRTRVDWKKIAVLFFTGLFFTAVLFVAGCKKNDSNPVTNSVTTVTDNAADAADAISDPLATNNGGAMDQVNNVFEIAGGGVGDGVLGKTTADASLSGANYDSTTMSWTMTLGKGDSSLLPLYYGY